MRRRLRFGLLAFGLTPLVLYLGLRLGLLSPLITFSANRILAAHSPLQLRVGRLRTDLASFVEADQVLVLAPVKGALLPLLSVDSLRLEFRGWDALRGRLDWQDALSLARVRGLNLFLLRNADGDWNLSGLSRRGPARPGGPGLAPALPATRLELEDCQVVLADEARDFRATIEGLEGTLDTRALPLVAFTLNGSTDGHRRDNLSVAGEWDRRDGALYSRLDLDNVELARYINYVLPAKGVRFEGGQASFSVRLRRRPGGDAEASGRAVLAGGSLRIPGIDRPLDGIDGAVVFDQGSLSFDQARAHFLGATWTASGSLNDLRQPTFNVRLAGPSVPLEALSEQVRGLERLGLSGSAAVSATLSGPVKAMVVQATLEVPRAGIAGVELSDLSVGARLTGTRLELKGLRAGLWGGRVAGNADMGLARGGRLKAELELSGVDLDQAAIHGQRPLPVRGRAQARLKASGPLRAPDLDLALSLPQASLGGMDLGAFTATAQWGAAGLDARFGALRGRIDGRVAFGRGPQGQFHHSRITLKAMDLSATAAALAQAGSSLALPDSAVRAGALLERRVAGTVDAALSLEGPLRSPQLWVELGVKGGHVYPPEDGPLALRDPTAGLDFRLNGALGLHAGALQLGRATAPLKAVLGLRKSGGGVELQALGHYPLRASGAPGHLALDLDGDLRLLDSLALFDKTQGRLSGDVILGGTPDAPSADGKVTLKGFQTDPTQYLAPIRGGDLSLRMRGQDVRLEHLNLGAGGQVAATGYANLARGLSGLSGSLTVNTDDKGLRFDHWDAFGSGSVKLDGFTVGVDGPDSPLTLGGRAVLSDALIVYGGRDPSAAQAPLTQTVRSKRPLAFNLRIGVGANVWYEKHQPPVVDVTKASSMLDPSAWLEQTLGNLMEAIKRPDLYFRLAPTDQDFMVTGEGPDIQLQGQLAIDRGRITILENEFQIKPQSQAALIRFNGRHGEVQATAVGHLHYSVTDPNTQRLIQKTVDVSVLVSPMSEEDLERSGLENSFLNFAPPEFTSDPPLVPNDDELNRKAILNLIVLGDPMVDSNGADNGGQAGLGAAQLDRLISAELRKQIASLSQHGFKLLGSRFIDVFRVVPRLKVGGSGAPAPASTVGGSTAAQTQGSNLVLSDVTVELGKSLSDKLYASVQGIYFDPNAAAQSAQMPINNSLAMDANYTVDDYGGRAGLEYQVTSTRTLEAYYNYAVNDELDPMPHLSYNAPIWGVTVQLRNTIPTDNYSAAVSRQRRWDYANGVRP